MISLGTGLLVTIAPPESAVAAAPCPAVASNEAAAQATARRCGLRVEAGAARTEYSRLFANPDGTLRLEASAVPRWVRRTDGSWADIETGLRIGPAGRLVPAATLADVSFAPGGSAPLAQVRQAGHTFELSWPSALPVPRITDDGAVYPNVLPGVNLHVRATADGFAQSLEVTTATAAANPALSSLVYKVDGNVRVESRPDGGLLVRGRDGRVVGSAAGAWMWDSSDDPAAAGEVRPGTKSVAPAKAARSSAARPGVAARIAPVEVKAAGDELRLVPDNDLLRGPATVFPVFIDPVFWTSAWTSKWAYANSIDRNWEVYDKAWLGRNPYDGTLYRSFFDFPIWGLKGKHILSAEVDLLLDHSYSCSPTWANMYRTGGITVGNKGRMPWGTYPLPGAGVWLAGAQGNANQAGGCGYIQPDMWMEFSSPAMVNDLQHAANNFWDGYTVAVCACDASGQYESAQDRWKYFYTAGATSTPTIVVSYNSYPGTPANLTTSTRACGGLVGTTSPTLRAQYVDVDSGDVLTGTFQYRQLPSGATVSVADPTERPSNNYGQVTLGLGSAAEGRTYAWRVQTRDSNNDLSPWSAWCEFTVNTLASNVTATAADGLYRNDGAAHGGPGVSGQFTFAPVAGSPGAENIVSYEYWFTGRAHNTATVAAGGSLTVMLTPPQHGLNTLNVHGRNAAGTPGTTAVYQFLVGAPSAPLAHWPLDTIDGHNFTDVLGNADLTPVGDVTWNQDARLIGESTASFDAVTESPQNVPGYATAAGTGLDTSGSFSVSAWVRIRASECTWNAAVSADGAHASAFQLKYNCWTGRWTLWLTDRDVWWPVAAEAISSTSGVAGQWTHLVGVWDEAERKLRLYVDGALAAEVTPSQEWLASRGTGWNATGPLVVGRDRWADADGSYFAGEIADVRIWNRVVVPDDINGTPTDPAAGTVYRPGILAPIEVGNWNFSGGVDCFCGDALDGSYWGRSLTLSGWDTSPPGSGFTSDAHDADDALWTDGVSGFASTNGPVLRTDESFTIAAWVRPRPQPGCAANIAISADGEHSSAFMLGYSCWSGLWWLRLTDRDVWWPSAAQVQSSAPAELGTWTHLVGVWDEAKRKLQLYVNGELAGETTPSEEWLASRGAGWNASGPLVVGRDRWADTDGSFFAGEIDQVAMFAGAMNAIQVANLHATS